jgi:SAM-dependent methyltransferase
VSNPPQPWIAKRDSKLLFEFLPDGSSRQANSLREALRVLDGAGGDDSRVAVLDLGCGEGASHDAFFARNEKIRWIGLDIIDSDEIRGRKRKGLPFCAYDGLRIPLADDSMDIIYSRQVFEHVRHPESLLSETRRVLKTGGTFVGSTSHLEPFHSRSYWNYTPYGFCVMLRDAGFHSIEVRPGIDAVTLICRRCFGFVRLTKLFEPFFKIESPMNLMLELGLRLLGQSAKMRNVFKLIFSGHFCFVARK